MFFGFYFRLDELDSNPLKQSHSPEQVRLVYMGIIQSSLGQEIHFIVYGFVCVYLLELGLQNYLRLDIRFKLCIRLLPESVVSAKQRLKLDS